MTAVPTTDQRYWENWDVPGVARHIDAFWVNCELEYQWRRWFAYHIRSEISPRSTVLEIGSGSGLIFEQLRNHNVVTTDSYVGGDVSINMLEIARERFRDARFEFLDIYSLCCDDASYDYVICVDVLQHLPNYSVPLKELMRVSRDKLVVVSWFHEQDTDVVEHTTIESASDAALFCENVYSLPLFLDFVRANSPKPVADIRVRRLLGKRFAVCIEFTSHSQSSDHNCPSIPKRSPQNLDGYPETTIITATYNKPEFLAQAALSVQCQTVAAWRWWIVLDGADSPTIALAERLAGDDSRITVFRESTTEEERKAVYRPAAIINHYYPRVATPYLCWLSDDDLMEPRFLELLVQELESNPDCHVAFGHCEVITQIGADNWKLRDRLRADKRLGFGTGIMPNCVIDGGQLVQSKFSYDALRGYQLPTGFDTAGNVDGVYMNALAEQFTFFPVPEKVLTHRDTYLSTHQRGHR